VLYSDPVQRSSTYSSVTVTDLRTATSRSIGVESSDWWPVDYGVESWSGGDQH
jgi:hypothetical protein